MPPGPKTLQDSPEAILYALLVRKNKKRVFFLKLLIKSRPKQKSKNKQKLEKGKKETKATNILVCSGGTIESRT